MEGTFNRSINLLFLLLLRATKRLFRCFPWASLAGLPPPHVCSHGPLSGSPGPPEELGGPPPSHIDFYGHPSDPPSLLRVFDGSPYLPGVFGGSPPIGPSAPPSPPSELAVFKVIIRQNSSDNHICISYALHLYYTLHSIYVLSSEKQFDVVLDYLVLYTRHWFANIMTLVETHYFDNNLTMFFNLDTFNKLWSRRLRPHNRIRAVTEKKNIDMAVKESLKWLGDNKNAENEDYEEKLKEVESVEELWMILVKSTRKIILRSNQFSKLNEMVSVWQIFVLADFKALLSD
ncbi:hypothetical protein LguiB_025692 [Lonicera macranthoides]